MVCGGREIHQAQGRRGGSARDARGGQPSGAPHETRLRDDSADRKGLRPRRLYDASQINHPLLQNSQGVAVILSIVIGIALAVLIVALLPQILAVLAFVVGVVLVGLVGAMLVWMLGWMLGWNRLVSVLVVVLLVGLLAKLITLLVRLVRWISSARRTKSQEGSNAAKSPILQAALDRERLEGSPRALRSEDPNGKP